MTPVALMVGSPRIVPAVKIVNPMGNPDLNPEAEKTLRRDIAAKALQSLQTDVSVSTLFERNK
jgi:glycine/betaine/sarcosine/D-proline reductase family selenoprotein B